MLISKEETISGWLKPKLLELQKFCLEKFSDNEEQVYWDFYQRFKEIQARL